MAEKEALELERKSLQDRIGHLQKNQEDLQAELSVLQDRIVENGRAKAASSARPDPLVRSQLDELQSDVLVLITKSKRMHN